MYIRTSVSPLFMSSLPHASYCPLPQLLEPALPAPTCACLPCISTGLTCPHLPLPAFTCLACLHLPPPASAWPCSAFPALPGLAYPLLRLSCIVRSCPALLAFVQPYFTSPGFACFAVLSSFVPFVYLLFLLFLSLLSAHWY